MMPAKKKINWSRLSAGHGPLVVSRFVRLHSHKSSSPFDVYPRYWAVRIPMLADSVLARYPLAPVSSSSWPFKHITEAESHPGGTQSFHAFNDSAHRITRFRSIHLSPFEVRSDAASCLCSELTILQFLAPQHLFQSAEYRTATMISDDELYRLAIFLGSVAMVLIVLYHFFEVNSSNSALSEKAAAAKPAQQAPAVGKSSGVAKS